jgi:hypothetical protein
MMTPAGKGRTHRGASIHSAPLDSVLAGGEAADRGRHSSARLPEWRYKALAAALACLGWVAVASAQNAKTWNGSVSSDWFDPNNWTPPGVPATNDIVNFSSGTLNATAPVTIYGQFNWTGGTLTGIPMTIATNGSLSLNGGGATLVLRGALTNAGTVNWVSGGLSLDNCAGGVGPIVNATGALWDVQCDQATDTTCHPGYGATSYFQNFGTLRKSASTGATSLNIPLLNAGTVTVLQGNLNLNNGGTVDGTFSTATGTLLYFNGGTFTAGAAPFVSGSGISQFRGER